MPVTVDSQPAAIERPAVPWGTVVLFLLALAALGVPRVSDGLIYDRDLILRGQLWRAWTGHFVHFGFSHFFWDFAVFLPAGIWLERAWPVLARGFFLICPLVISVCLLGFDPTLARYAGISGLATGVLVLLALRQLDRRPGEPRWFWFAVLALVALKIGRELVSGAPLLVTDFATVRTVPWAHVVGAAAAIAGWLPGRWRR